MEAILIIYLLTIPADYVDVGVSAYSKWNSAEIGLENPLATLEAGLEYRETTIYYQHTSGIKSVHDKYGINTIGIKYRIK